MENRFRPRPFPSGRPSDAGRRAYAAATVQHYGTLENTALNQSEGLLVDVAGTSRPPGTVDLAASTGLWASWATIAVEADAEARGARALLLARQQAGDELKANDELHPALVAIAGAAFAIVNLYGAVQPHVAIPLRLRQRWAANPLARHGWILETFKRSFRLGPGTSRWPAELRGLFGLREGNVHHDGGFRTPRAHPVGTTTPERDVHRRCPQHAIDSMLEALELAGFGTRAVVARTRPLRLTLARERAGRSPRAANSRFSLKLIGPPA